MKRLGTRLADLETRQGITQTDAARRLLVALLARRDALFWPWRRTSVAVDHRQRDYHTGREGIKAKATGQGDWKAAYEARAELVATGKALALYSGGQITSLFLTHLGELEARRMVGSRLWTLERVRLVWDAWHDAEGVEFGGCKLVHESELFGLDCLGDPGDWQDSVEAVLPLLTAGLLRSRCDTQGRVCFELGDVTEWPSGFPTSDVGVWEPADAIYLEHYDSERAVLSTIEESGAELSIPLPAATGLHEAMRC